MLKPKRLTHITAIVFTLATIAYAVLFKDSARRQNVEVIACSSFGCVYCGGYQAERCGMHFYNCVDEREYRCMQNATIKKVVQ
jgi:hypothetical protein